MIAITGANGLLGRLTIQSLLKKRTGESLVAVVRRPESMEAFRALGVDIRQADYDNAESLRTAFGGVTKALQISTAGVGIRAAQTQEKNVVDALEQCEVGHIVYTSMTQARPGALFQGTAVHWHTEQQLLRTGIPFTFFRNNMYMEMIPQLIGDALQTGEIRYPAGNGKIAYVARTDIAEALANVLTEPGHENRTYEITGTEAYSFGELAKLITLKKGIPVTYHEGAPGLLRQRLQHFGMEEETVELLLSMARAVKGGEFAGTGSDLETLLHRPPLQLDEFIKTF